MLVLRRKSRLDSVCIHCVMLYGSEAGAVKMGDKTRLDRNDAKMVR